MRPCRWRSAGHNFAKLLLSADGVVLPCADAFDVSQNGRWVAIAMYALRHPMSPERQLFFFRDRPVILSNLPNSPLLDRKRNSAPTL